MSQEVKKFQVSYNPNRYRVRINFVASDVLDQDFDIDDILNRAITRIEKEKTKNTIVDYIVFDKTFRKFVEVLKKDLKNGGNPSTKLEIILVGGAVDIPNLFIEESSVEDVSFFLNLAPSETLEKMNYDSFKITLLCMLKKFRIYPPNMAQVHSAFVKAQQGTNISHLPISPLPAIQDNSLYKIYTNKVREEIILVINRKEAFYKINNVKMFETVFQSVILFSKNLKKRIYLYKKDIIDEFNILASGRRRYGVDLPVSILIGNSIPPSYTESYINKNANIINEIVNVPYKIKDEEFGLLKLDISDDSMSAKIKDFDKALYDNPDFNKNWIVEELKRLKITFGVKEEYLQKLEAAIEAKEDLNDFLVASGEAGEAATEPYIYPLYLQSEQNTDQNVTKNNLELTSKSQDLRSSQAKNIVKVGQVVAEIRYKYPASASTTIFSEQIEPTNPGIPPDISIGEGFKVNPKGYIIALKAGAVSSDDKQISLSPVYTHKGDINLQTGDIIFDGAVEIEGSVDEGSTIIATGDVIIKGSVTKANIKTSGSLTVSYGITTGSLASVEAKGKITADFVEFSNIYCDGDLEVNKAVMNSNVHVGGFLKVNEQTGVISGGNIVCNKGLVTSRLGSVGSSSNIMLGVDWRVMRSIHIRTNRMKKMLDIAKEQKAIYQDLNKRFAGQKTAKHVELEKKLKRKLPRYNDILAKMKEHLEKAKQKLKYNMSAYAKINGDLFANNMFEICGIKIPVTYSLKAVTIDSKKSRGTYIHKMKEDGSKGEEGNEGGVNVGNSVETERTKEETSTTTTTTIDTQDSKEETNVDNNKEENKEATTTTDTTDDKKEENKDLESNKENNSEENKENTTQDKAAS